MNVKKNTDNMPHKEKKRKARGVSHRGPSQIYIIKYLKAKEEL